MIILISNYYDEYFLKSLISCFIYKLSENSPSQFPKVQDDIFRYLVLFNQLYKTQKY